MVVTAKSAFLGLSFIKAQNDPKAYSDESITDEEAATDASGGSIQVERGGETEHEQRTSKALLGMFSNKSSPDEVAIHNRYNGDSIDTKVMTEEGCSH